MKVDGSEPVSNIFHLYDTREIAWSPSGERLAFVADWDGDNEIYVINTDGSGFAQLTFNSVNERNPAWSPDGTRIVFDSQRDLIPDHEGPPQEIYIMDADGSNQVRVTNNFTSDYCPAWSPDGNQIAFSSFYFSYDSVRIEIINADGSGQSILVDTPDDDYCPIWAPDGSKILLEINDGRQSNIALMNPDGSKVEMLTQLGARNPSWHPDGSWISYSSSRDGEEDIFIHDLDSQVMINLTNSDSLQEYSPVWAPTSVTAIEVTLQLELTPTMVSSCTNQAEFISDVTIPDGTKLRRGEAFIKTWRFRNTGTCAWNSGYSIVFDSGEPMGAFLTPVTLETVPPGSSVDVSLSLVAPDSVGIYTGVFQLASDFGDIITRNGFWVKIEVIEPG